MLYQQIRIVCPCGRLLKTAQGKSESKSVTKGTIRCPSCKRKVAYQLVGINSYTSYCD